ncbi:hypothetical protein Tco_1428132 [Tanacetum coccineum]
MDGRGAGFCIMLGSAPLGPSFSVSPSMKLSVAGRGRAGKGGSCVLIPNLVVMAKFGASGLGVSLLYRRSNRTLEGNDHCKCLLQKSIPARMGCSAHIHQPHGILRSNRKSGCIASEMEETSMDGDGSSHRSSCHERITRTRRLFNISLRKLPPHLEYAFLEGDDKLPVIIAKDLKDEEKAALLKVLKSHKRAIAWKLSDIKGVSPEFCTHKILMEEDYEPSVQSQRRVNPKIHDVIKKEVEKLLDAGLIYPISDSPWVSPVHCVPKKGGMTVITNDENELIPTRLVTGWRVCIDYRKLNEATRKDHFPLPFMDQMLERLG